MQYRNRPCNILLLAVFLVSIATPLLAASTPGEQGNHWGQPQNGFSAFGVVVSTTADTLTVQLEGASRLLRDDVNLEPVVFQVQDSVRVKTFGGAMGKGGMMAGGKMGNHGGHGGHLTLADVQAKDNILISGYVDSSGNQIVTRIAIWLF
jgi:hypothetical protein